MKEWKRRQACFHRFLKPTDLIGYANYIHICECDILKLSIAYFKEEQEKLYFPAKAYCVAIIYAYLISKYFNENFYEVLNDSTLLFENQMGFVPYSKNKEIYDSILENISLEEIETSPLSQVKTTVYYFFQEFFLDTKLLLGLQGDIIRKNGE